MSEVRTTIAAGCLVWRRNQNDEIEILLVHRPKYDDWSIPKGKAEEREPLVVAAYRETIEETGIRVRISRKLGTVEYSTLDGRKVVTYWSGKFIESVGSPDAREVDEIRWFKSNEVLKFLSRETDREIVEKFLKSELDSKVLILLRHAKALPRSEWNGEDCDRPLSDTGQLQSEALISQFLPFEIVEIHSSNAVRCYETINPLARYLKLNYFFTDSLSEEIFSKKRGRVFKYIDRLLENTSATLICSHNPILPDYLQEKLMRQGFSLTNVHLNPGDAWIVHHISNEIIGVDFLPAPFTA